MRSSDKTLAAAMAELANTIHSPDGVANAAIREAGQRITELSEELTKVKDEAYQLWEDTAGEDL